MKSLISNNLGRFLVEDCQRVGIKPFLKKYKSNLKGLILSSEIELLDKNIKLTSSKTGNGGHRYWFICPSCQKRMGILFYHPLSHHIGCRTCLNLEYRKRRFKGMIESQI